MTTKEREGAATGKRRARRADSGKDAKALLEKTWSREMALCGLKRIYETALEGARTEVRDKDGALVEVKFSPTALGAATKAIEVANRMLGYTSPEEEEGETEGLLSVELGEAEAFAE